MRTAKTGFVDGKEGWNASGAVEYDRKGRTVKEGMTEFIQGDIRTLLESLPKMTSLYTAYEYDEKDRQIKATLPDGSEQFSDFEIKNEDARCRQYDNKQKNADNWKYFYEKNR